MAISSHTSSQGQSNT